MRTAVLIGCAPATLPPPSPSAFGLMYEGAISEPRKTTSLCDPLALLKGIGSSDEYVFNGL